MAKQITIDPNGVALDLVDRASGIDVVGLGWPAPTDEDVWAEGAMTEGARLAQSRPQNVERRVEVRCFGPDGRTRLRELLEKVGKLRREGGEVALTLKDNSTATWRVETARIDGPSDEQWFLHHFRDSVVVPVVFVCQPYGRGVESQAAQVTETSLPVVTASFDAPAGDVPAEARIVIEDLQGADQGFVAWGVQSRYVSSANTAQLFYEAEELTPLGGATVTNVSGASGGQVVRQGTLTPVWAAMLSFQHATHGPLTHVGDFNVWVRARRPVVAAPPGHPLLSSEISIALEWGVGDMTRVTRNDPIVFATNVYEGLFLWLNLGQVHVPEDASQWDGRVIARSTVDGDTLTVDCVWLQPVGEGAGEIATTVQIISPSTFDARDDFSHSPGPLTGNTLPVGGIWSGAGDIRDFSINNNDGTAQRTAVSDVDVYSGRYALAGTVFYSTVVVSVDVTRSSATSTSGTHRYGVVARYLDTTNWLMAVVCTDFPGGESNPDAYRVRVLKRIGGVVQMLLDERAPGLGRDVGNGIWATVQLWVTQDGRWFAWNGARGSSLRLAGYGYDEDLATGGALASGLVGIYDVMTDAKALTRDLDNFTVSQEIGESQAIVASRSLEIAHDGARREDPTGTLWTPVTIEGDYATVPPAGREQRDARVTALTSRGPRIAPGIVIDPAIDDKRLTVHTTPRYLLIP